MLGILLFAVAWMGHGYWLMITLNRIYSRPFHRSFLRTLRKIYGLFLVFGPPAFAIFISPDLFHAAELASDHPWIWGPHGYMIVCAVLGGIWFPVITLWRLIPSKPSQVLEETTVVYDIEKELGQRPIGSGKHRSAATWKWNGLFQLEFTTLRLSLEQMPKEWEGLSILHLSDFHLYGTPDLTHYQALIKRCMADGMPDLVVLSGDMIDDDIYLDWIGPILAELKWNVAAFAVLGNHDWWQSYDLVRERLNSSGFHVISNSWMRVDVRGQPLLAIGHEGPWFKPEPDLAHLPDGFRLLVSHSPDNIEWAKTNLISLMLSGHNHGGQIRIPIVGSMFVPSWYSRKYDMGTFFEAPTLLHVNRGIAGKEPIRFRCPPQVTRIILTNNKSD